jgi:hypothetical protein
MVNLIKPRFAVAAIEEERERKRQEARQGRAGTAARGSR